MRGAADERVAGSEVACVACVDPDNARLGNRVRGCGCHVTVRLRPDLQLDPIGLCLREIVEAAAECGWAAGYILYHVREALPEHGGTEDKRRARDDVFRPDLP